MTSKKESTGGTFVGDATNLLIPIGLLAAREGIKWYKKPAAASKPKAAPAKKTKAAAPSKPKRRMRGGGDGESFCGPATATPAKPATPETPETPPAPQAETPATAKGGAKKKTKPPSKSKAAEAKKVLEMAREAVQRHAKKAGSKKGGSGSASADIINQFVNLANKIGGAA
jgi:hypothetical protein